MGAIIFMGAIISLIVIIGTFWFFDVFISKKVHGVSTIEEQMVICNIIKNANIKEYISNSHFRVSSSNSESVLYTEYLHFYLEKRLIFKNRWYTLEYGLITDEDLHSLIELECKKSKAQSLENLKKYNYESTN